MRTTPIMHSEVMLPSAIKPQSTPVFFLLHLILNSETSFKLSWLWLQILDPLATTRAAKKILSGHIQRPFPSVGRPAGRSCIRKPASCIRKVGVIFGNSYSENRNRVIIRKLGGQEIETT